MPHPLYAKARASWDLGVELRKKGDWNAAANRLYYGVFQAAAAYFYESATLTETLGKDRSESTSVHREVKSHLKSREKNTFEDLLVLRKTADYKRDSVQAQDLHDELINQGSALLRTYLSKTQKP